MWPLFSMTLYGLDNPQRPYGCIWLRLKKFNKVTSKNIKRHNCQHTHWNVCIFIDRVWFGSRDESMQLGSRVLISPDRPLLHIICVIFFFKTHKLTVKPNIWTEFFYFSFHFFHFLLSLFSDVNYRAPPICGGRQPQTHQTCSAC